MKSTSRSTNKASGKAAKNSAKPRTKPALTLAVQYAIEDAALPPRPGVRRWVRAALTGAAEITVRFVGVEEGRDLNARYRGKDKPTNVLSFPYARAPRLQGDLVLCLPVALDEAAAQGKPVEAHFAHLVVHGMLHLQGHDHETAGEARAMEEKERDILALLGYPDPY